MADSDSSNSGAIVFVIIVIAVVAGLIFGPGGKKPFNLTGLWEGDGEYLFVKEKDNKYECRYTTIPQLHHEKWEPKDKPPSIQVINAREEIKANIYLKPEEAEFPDELNVVLDTGQEYNLKITENEELSFFKSLTLYTRCYHFLGIVYPDGIYRLLALFAAAALFGLALAYFIKKETFNFFMWVIIVVPVVVLLMPFIAGYIFGFLKWIFLGWWDGLRIGKFIVYFMMILLLIPLVIGLVRIKSFKERIYTDKPKRVRAFFWLFLASDSAAVVINFRVFLDWFT